MLNRSLPGADDIRVAIVEDDSLLRDGLCQMVQEAQGLCCSAAFPSAEEALRALRDRPSDVLLLDIGLPGMAGSDAVPLFRQAYPVMAILMLTVFSDRAKVFASICNGACGYLLKSTPPSQLFEAIGRLIRRLASFSEIAREILTHIKKWARHNSRRSDRTGQRLPSLLSQGHSLKHPLGR
jgi:DNA-binding NarL/FixJ family response regulator